MPTRTELRDETHERVLNSAERLFQAKGFGASSVRSIASAARVSVGTVMSVGDKNGLLVRIFDRHIAAVHEARRLQAPSAAEGTCEDRADAALRPFVTLFTAQPSLGRTYASILVAGGHDSIIFTELAASLRHELQSALTARGCVEASHAASLAQAIYYVFIGTLLAFSAGENDDRATLARELRTQLSTLIPCQELTP